MDAQIRAVISLLEQALALLRSMLPPPSPTKSPGQEQVAWGKKVSPTFLARAKWIADTLGFPLSWLMTWMAFESARTFRSDVRNPRSSATGLIQFMRKTAIGLGTTVEALAAMTPEDQLNYVYKYLKPYKGRIKDPIDGYLAILYPAAIGKGLDEPVFVKGSDVYAANAGLDTNRDHVITKREVGQIILNMLEEGKEEANAAWI